LVGRTGVDSDIVDFELEFFGNCNVNGFGATVTCSDAASPNSELGTARWHATNDNPLCRQTPNRCRPLDGTV
jgi:hypothetical protein